MAIKNHLLWCRNLAEGTLRISSILEAAGASLLILLPQIVLLIAPSHLVLSHHDLPLKHVVGGIAIDFVVLFLALVTSGWLLKRLPLRAHDALLAAGVGLLILWTLKTSLPSLLGAGVENDLLRFQRAAQFNWLVFIYARHRLLVCSVIGVIFVLLPWAQNRFAQWVVLASRFSIACLAFCWLWIAPELAGLAMSYPNTTVFRPVAVQSPSRNHKRIVWILFDELSYNLIFDHPPAGQTFPNFQKFGAESVSLSNVEPIGMFTDRIVPSLLMGNTIDKVKTSFDGQFLYQDSVKKRWLAYDPNQTLFGLANREGWNPAVAGWYNPYCRIFATVLTQCSWRPLVGDTIFPESSEQSSVMTIALAFPQHYLNRALPDSASESPQKDALRWVSNYQAIMESSADLIQNENLRFVFLHLPVPHPPGYFDRKTHQFRNCGTYLDNLALADDTMGKILEEINKSPSASETTVIVSSDHSWRVPIWYGGPEWTSEEQAASGGVFETRPVFLVHYPGQTTGSNLSTRQSELIEHDIIAAMLKDQLKDPQELTQFVAK